uniref:Uncharacterized protein n=1 Tax=Romanomermis culicivorax TaxID=13658 RepID=A0A915IN74_ROMCU
MAAWKNYQNGDKSALAVFNIVAGAVFTIASVISTHLLGLTLAVAAANPIIGWIVFAVGTAFYIIQNIWKIIGNVGGLEAFCISSWEFIKSIPDFLRHLIQYLETGQAEKTAKVVNRALEIMENNTMIQNEIEKYSKVNQIDVDDDHLSWWNDQGKKFPSTKPKCLNGATPTKTDQCDYKSPLSCGLDNICLKYAFSVDKPFATTSDTVCCPDSDS